MATNTMNVRVRGKRDTLANWTNNNPVLLSGEVVQVIMTDGTLRHKTGDGTSTFSQLSYDDEIAAMPKWFSDDYDTDKDGVVDNAEKLGGQLPEHYASVDDLAEKASLPVSDTPPEDSEFWVDTGVSPTMLRRWRGADVPTAREYQQTINADTGSASLSIDNAQGQLRSVALEMGCVAKQAGTGDPSPENIRAISGRESVEIAACGKNLLDIAAFSPSHTNGVHVDVEANTLHVYTTDTGSTWRAANSKPFWARGGITYKLSATLSAYDGGYSVIAIRLVANNMIVKNSGIIFGGQTGRKVVQFTPTEDIYVYLSAFCTNDAITSGDCTYTQIQLEIGETATEYEPYRSMGGGTVTPTEPLYGLPGAEDTVEVDVDGDVTVTRRTGYIASYSDESLPGGWISSHDVYAAGTTPTTGAQVVYELAEPTTETLSPIAPIAPQPGVVNIFTDADTFSATITGSGWDTIGDMGGLEAQLAAKADAADLAAVATSGSYNDLTDKPTIPSPVTVDDTITAGGTNPVTGGAIFDALEGKVNAESGKGLSTNDYTTTEKNKLAGIAEGANNYTHPATHPASMITGLSTVATSGSYNDLADKPNIAEEINVDDAITETSQNPVTSAAIFEALESKSDAYKFKSYHLLSDAGLFTGTRTTAQLLDIMPQNTTIRFSHTPGDSSNISDLPGNKYGFVTLSKWYCSGDGYILFGEYHDERNYYIYNGFPYYNPIDEWVKIATEKDVPSSILQSVFNDTITLSSTGWTQGDDSWYSQTVTATGVTATAIVYVAFHPDSRSAFLDAGIYCSAQAANQLTFKAASQPESNISVNVHAMEVSA